MKRILAVALLVVMVATLFVGCKSKFTCQICQEEKTGKKQTIEAMGQKMTVCESCKKNYEVGLDILSGGTGDLEDALEGLEDFGYDF